LPFSVTEVQATPNPNALKFVLDRSICESPTSFLDAPSAQGHPLASQIFAIAGVRSVLLLRDFVTVGKAPEARWSDITSRVKRLLASA
jgi:hypothetical protein